MAIQDIQTNEVRIRDAEAFSQIPNNTPYGDATAIDVGAFAQIGVGNDGNAAYFTVGAGEMASHLLVKATPAATVREIAMGEPVQAITGGPGRVTIPFATSATVGAKLTTNENGYAVPWTAGNDLHIVGESLDTVVIEPGETFGWGDALITLPTSTIGSVQTSETANG